MKTKGFSLIELILTVAIIAILAGIIIPRAGWTATNTVQAETAGRQFGSYLKLARSLAITHASTNNQGYKVVLSSSQPYTYSLINTATSEVVKGPIALPAGVDRSGDRTYQFMPLGNLPGSKTLETSFSKDDNTSVVSVTPIGKITVQ